MRRWLLITALVLPTSAPAQQATTLAPVEWTAPPLGARLRVAADGILAGRQTATLLRRHADTLVLAIRNDDPVAVPLSRISSLETSLGTSQQRGAVRGAVIVGAFGALLHVLAGQSNRYCRPQTCSNGSVSEGQGVTGTGLITGAAYGALFGAVFGTHWPTEAWQSLDLPQRLSTRAAPSHEVAAASMRATR